LEGGIVAEEMVGSRPDPAQFDVVEPVAERIYAPGEVATARVHRAVACQSPAPPCVACRSGTSFRDTRRRFLPVTAGPASANSAPTRASARVRRLLPRVRA